MHYRLEIIMPPVDDIESAVGQIMAPFDENTEGEDSDRSHAFWDWWVIGGRYAGSKIKDSLDPEKLDVFYKALSEMKVTVSSLTAGKQTLYPASQIPVVDALWQKHFPESPEKQCILFSHSNDQYSSDSLLHGDVCRYADLPDAARCDRVIFAAQDYEGKKLEAVRMYQTDVWNGVNRIDTVWDGTLKMAREMFYRNIESYADQYKSRITPQPDWLVVTVDYHS